MDIIKSYLDSTYSVNIDDYYDGHAIDITTKKSIYKNLLIDELIKIFGLDPMISTKLVDEWWELKRKPFIQGELEVMRKLNEQFK